MRREPVVTVAAVTAVVAAAIALLTAFGVPVTDDQKIALLGFVSVVAPLAAAFVQRTKVAPVATLGGDVDQSPVDESDHDTSHLGNGVAE